MRSLQREIDQLRSAGAGERELATLRAEYDKLSLSVGGDRPARVAASSSSNGLTATSTSGVQTLAAPTCGGAPTTTANFAGTTGPITPPATFQGVTFTATVSGLSTYLWDLNLNTEISHTWTSDLDITLESPAGTVVVVSTDLGGALANVYNGTVWDEQGSDTAFDHVHTNLVVAPLLVPEGRFSRFRGEDPNGVWTLRIIDDTATDVGDVNSWSLDIATLASAPAETTNTFTNSPALPISAAGTPTVTDTIAVSGQNTYLTDVKLYVEITHSWNEDLDLTLTSPLGTVVKVATDCGGAGIDNGFDNGYNGTLFDGDSSNVVTDRVFVNLVAEPLLSPEGSFANFDGEDPNGNWTLTIVDDTNTDGGTLVRWDVIVTSASPQTPSAPANFAGATGAIPDNPGGGAVPVPTIYTANVSGVGTYLWDVDLTTFITHTSAADIDMTLTSPAGTTVTISTDNGGTNDDVFNGTVWDDSAVDLVADYVYTNLVAVPTLAPEGRLAAFRGQDPNGTWTLTVTDDTDLALGDVSTWSLDVATLTTAPASTPTTYSQSPNLAIPSNVVFTGTDTIAASGLETYVIDIEVYVEVTHTWSADVNLSLTSPSGTIVQLTTLNGAGNDNVYNGTLFTAAVTDSVTDHVYANLVTATPLSPEGGLDTLIGQDPNGNWTLTVFDPVAADGGTFVRWDLTIKTCVGAGNAFCTNGSLGIDHTTMCPCTPGAPGNGCGHSFDPNGANISATGSSAADTVVLHSQFEPVSSFTLFMQHANPGDTVFHDGVLCAANPLIRLRGRAAVAGEAFFPNSNFANDSTTTLSTRGMTFPGSGATMRYAAWYRNASSTFCPPATANVTNGWVITW